MSLLWGGTQIKPYIHPTELSLSNGNYMVSLSQKAVDSMWCIDG